MQTRLQTQEGWWRHAKHTSDQVQENLSDPDTPFKKVVSFECWLKNVNHMLFDETAEAEAWEGGCGRASNKMSLLVRHLVIDIVFIYFKLMS